MCKKLFEKMNKVVKKMTWCDVKLIKLGAAAFTLMIAKLWPPLLSLEWYWYAALGVVFILKPLKLYLGK